MDDETVVTDQEPKDAEEPSADEAAPADETAPTDESAPKAKKKGKLGIKILIAVAAVIVVLGGGGGAAYAIFHSNPAFCNFVCHTPMDPYVESYQSGTSINAAQVDSGARLSVTLHKESDQQLNCLSCHVPDMAEQIQEGIKWVTGDYELPLEMKLAVQLKEGVDGKDGTAFCLREGCHEGITTLDELKAATSDQHRNPHDYHGGKLDCDTCHQTHEQSVLMCTQCHNDIDLPDGWLTYKEALDQKKAAGQ
ncbi:MAG: cytochrome c3 family protein [Coriobacteriales bacterium]|jgi:flagellar basal body-associated protein FliL|nr:cytochrome c3 family protein [Coriobacteriales bacterium]